MNLNVDEYFKQLKLFKFVLQLQMDSYIIMRSFRKILESIINYRRERFFKNFIGTLGRDP